MNERNELSGKKHIFISSGDIFSFLRALPLWRSAWLFSIKASLGTSPISSVPYVVSLFAPLTVGTAYDHYALRFYPPADHDPEKKISSHTADAASGCVFLRISDRFRRVGRTGITCNHYLQQWLVCLIGIFLVAVGVSLEVKAGVVVLAGEGVVLAICKVLP